MVLSTGFVISTPQSRHVNTLFIIALASESKTRKNGIKEKRLHETPIFTFVIIVLLQEDLVDETELHPGPWSEKFL